MYEGKVLLKKSEISVFGEVGGACLDLAGGGTRHTQGMLGLRNLVRSPIYKYVGKGKESEWSQRINIKKIRRSKVSGDPFVGSAIGCLRISRQPTSQCTQFEGSPHQASRGFHRQLSTWRLWNEGNLV